MKPVARAISDVRSSRTALAGSLQEIRKRLAPLEIANDVIARFDPELKFLGSLQTRIKRNPLLAVALLAGASWFANSGGGGSASRRTQSRIRAHGIINNGKGEIE